MNTNDDLFDGRIADWLEDDPVLAPSQIMETVQAALPSVPQRRRTGLPWGSWATPVRLGLTWAAIALMIALGANLIGRPGANIGGPPTPTPSPTPAASPSVERTQIPTLGLVPFTSPLYGYTIDVPREWVARVATQRLTSTQIPWADGNAVDYITAAVRSDAGEGGPLGSLDLASTDIEGRTLEPWTAATALDTCGEPQTTEAIEVDGEPARLLTYPWCNGYFHIWTTVAHGSTGAHLVWLNLVGTESADRELFLELLGTFRFPDAPPAPSDVASPEPS